MIRCIRILDTEEDTKCLCRRTPPRTSAGAPAAVARLQVGLEKCFWFCAGGRKYEKLEH